MKKIVGFLVSTLIIIVIFASNSIGVKAENIYSMSDPGSNLWDYVSNKEYSYTSTGFKHISSFSFMGLKFDEFYMYVDDSNDGMVKSEYNGVEYHKKTIVYKATPIAHDSSVMSGEYVCIKPGATRNFKCDINSEKAEGGAFNLDISAGAKFGQGVIASASIAGGYAFSNEKIESYAENISFDFCYTNYSSQRVDFTVCADYYENNFISIDYEPKIEYSKTWSWFHYNIVGQTVTYSENTNKSFEVTTVVSDMVYYLDK